MALAPVRGVLSRQEDLKLAAIGLVELLPLLVALDHAVVELEGILEYLSQSAVSSYIKQQGYTDVGVLVAFSGTVIADGGPYTEAGMNGFPDGQTR